METLRPPRCQAPHSAPAATAHTPADERRRGVLRLLFGSAFGWGLAALGAATGLWAAAVARFLVPAAASGASAWRKIGPPGDFPPGSVATKYKDSLGVWVVHAVYRGRPQIYALRATCTHLGCVVVWDEAAERFRCPCHGSGFDRRGLQCEGPAPRPLERCAIRAADDGRLEVATGQTFREELGQWTDPASYVSP